MKSELEIIKNQSHKLLSEKNSIIEEINQHKVARCQIGTPNLICTISIFEKPKDPNKEIRLFEELDKLQGVIKQ